MNIGTTTVLCIFVALIFLLLILFFNAVRIIPEYQRLVVFRLGRVLPSEKRLIGGSGPGLVLLSPGIDRGVKVDLRE